MWQWMLGPRNKFRPSDPPLTPTPCENSSWLQLMLHLFSKNKKSYLIKLTFKNNKIQNNKLFSVNLKEGVNILISYGVLCYIF